MKQGMYFFSKFSKWLYLNFCIVSYNNVYELILVALFNLRGGVSQAERVKVEKFPNQRKISLTF